jgi:hypothetical protein
MTALSSVLSLGRRQNRGSMPDSTTSQVMIRLQTSERPWSSHTRGTKGSGRGCAQLRQSCVLVTNLSGAQYLHQKCITWGYMERIVSSQGGV